MNEKKKKILSKIMIAAIFYIISKVKYNKFCAIYNSLYNSRKRCIIKSIFKYQERKGI